jgi:hypothetical protein
MIIQYIINLYKLTYKVNLGSTNKKKYLFINRFTFYLAFQSVFILFTKICYQGTRALRAEWGKRFT